MKTRLSTILFILIGFSVSVYAQNAPGASTASMASAADISAIKKVIADETDGYFSRNKEQWSNACVHEPQLQWSGTGSGGKVLLTNGWEAYEQQLGSNFTDTQSRPAATVQRDNYQVSIVGDAATATFNQSLALDTYRGTSREVRVLEKRGNAWKLVYVNSRATQQ